MARLHFDIRDLFRSIRMGWSGKKIWTGLCGLFLAWAVYTALVYAGFVMSGTSASTIWHQYGLFPGARPEAVDLLPGGVLHLIAMVLAGAILFASTTMMCKVTYQQLRGDDFYSSGDAFKFLKEHWGGAIFGPIAVFILFVSFVVGGLVIGKIAQWIPYLGEFGFAASFIPMFFASLVAVFMIVALATACLMSPAIVGTVGEDTLEVVIQAFSLAWSQPLRLVLYLLWLSICVFVGALLLSGFMTLALGLIVWACGLSMGDKLYGMIDIGRMYLPPFDFTSTIVDADDSFASVWRNTPNAEPSASVRWAGRLMGLNLIVLTGVFVAYCQAVFASGSSLVYVILRRKKDDENLLEWEDPNLDDVMDFSAESEAGEAEESSGDAETTGDRADAKTQE